MALNDKKSNLPADQIPQARPFTADEQERSANGPRYEHVKPSDLWGKGGDSNLAMAIIKKNPVRYRELQQEWRYEQRLERCPDSHYDRL